MTSNDFNMDDKIFNRNLNKLITKYNLCYSNIDENILRKTQEFEQEYFYNHMISNPNGSIHINDDEIKKTLDSGSSWMK